MNATKRLRPPRRVAPSLSASCRLFSASPPRRNVTADEAAERLLAAHGHANATVVRRQLIDPNQLAKLAFTLGRPTVSGIAVADDTILPQGTPVPAGYHLVYFTPGGVEADLGADGTDRSFNAPPPFSRRMWAGGKMEWPVSTTKDGLLVGDVVEERTRLVSATPKTSKSTGQGMVLVEVEKELWSPRGLAVVDRRSWIFRPAVDAQAAEQPEQPEQPFLPYNGASTITDSTDSTDHTDASATLTASGGSSGLVRTFCWSPVALFRFSALTFNGHKIHYNEDWTHRVEAHPGLVVHGPLNLINLLNYWQDANATSFPGGPRRVAYRAVAPLYAGESYQVRARSIKTMEGSSTPVWDVVAEMNGKQCMVAEIL